MTDFLIVGRGLAATVLQHTFYKQGLSFHVAGTPHLSQSSRVAAGIWNPVVFKRLMASWLAPSLINCLKEFYGACESDMSCRLLTFRRIIRPFNEVQEKELWKKKAQAELHGFLDRKIHPGSEIDAVYRRLTEFGYVLEAGNLDMIKFLDESTARFRECISEEVFDHRQLQIEDDHCLYGGRQYRSVIFCEGVKVKDNPYFKWIPLRPAKGEILTVELEKQASGTDIMNRGIFVLPEGNKTARVGATYNWTDQSDMPTSEGKASLQTRLEEVISGGYRVTGHQAGVRPSSSDRRPIIGRHPQHNNLYVFNGLGTKGVMLAPFFANNFVLFYLQKESLHPEVNISRFYSLYDKKN